MIIFLIIFTPLAFGAVYPWSMAIMELTALLMVAAWLLKRIHRRELKLERTPLNLPLLLFALLILFQMLPLPPSIMESLSPNTYNLYKTTLPGYDSDTHQAADSRPPQNNDILKATLLGSTSSTRYRTLTIYPHATRIDLLNLLTYIAIFFLVINHVRTDEQINRLLKAIIILGFLLSAFAIVQNFSGTDKIYWIWKPLQGGSPFGPYVNRNHFAGYISMVIPLTLGFLLGLEPKAGHLWPSGPGHQSPSAKWTTHHDAPAHRLFLLFALVVMIAALFLSLSRGGILSFLLGTLFLLNLSLFQRKSRMRPYVLVASAFLSAFLFLVHLGIAPVIERLSTFFHPGQEASATARMAVWQDTIAAAQDFPLLGTGLGTFQYIFPQYQSHSSDIPKFFDYAHNDYLQLLLETGLLGFILLSGGLALFLWKTLSQWGQRHDPFVKGVTMSGLAAIFSILLHSFVDFNLHIPANALLFTLILALTYKTAFLETSPSPQPSPSPPIHQPANQPANQPSDKLTNRLTNQLTNVLIFALTLFIALNIILTHLVPQDASYHLILAERAADRMVQASARDGGPAGVARSLQPGLKALAEYQKAVELNPSLAYSHLMLAWHYGNLNNLLANQGRESLLIPEIIREFQLAVKLDPIFSYSHRLFATWAFNQARRKRSLIDLGAREYRKAVALEPSLAGEALSGYFKFTRDYRHLKEILPDTPDSAAAVAHFLYEHNAWDQNEAAFLAEMQWAKAQHLGGRPSSLEKKGLFIYYRTLAEIYQKNQEHNKAISTLLEYLKIRHEDAEAHFWLADYSFYNGSKYGYFWAFSKLHHQKAVALSPDNAFFRKWYGRHLYYQKEFKEAASQLRKALELDPKDHEARSWLEECYQKADEYGLSFLFQ